MGRHRWTSRFTVEECHYFLDVEVFHRAGPALANASAASGTIFWTRDGDVIGTIRYEIVPSAGGVSVGIPRQFLVLDGGNRLVEERLISITTVRPHLGGKRFLFVCQCGSRVGRLYLPPGQQIFACRDCHNLTYRSVQQHDQRKYHLARHPRALTAALRSKDISQVLLSIGGLVLLVKW